MYIYRYIYIHMRIFTYTHTLTHSHTHTHTHTTNTNTRTHSYTCKGLLMSQFWYCCDSKGDIFLMFVRVSLILLMKSIVNGIADTFMSKKFISNTNSPILL